jgi:hypothetical protein
VDRFRDRTWKTGIASQALLFSPVWADTAPDAVCYGSLGFMEYLNCEQCLRLWAEYGVAVKAMLEAASNDAAANARSHS